MQKKYALGVCAAVAAVLVLAGPASAGTLVNTTSATLWGKTYEVSQWLVGNDLDAIDSAYNLEPEGMTLHDGILYVAGDRDDDETFGNLAAYDVLTTPGDLGSWTTIGTNPTGGDMWGPEGLTVNTSGAGYGAGMGQLVSVESKGDDRVGIIDLASGDILDVNIIDSMDDIAYVPTRDQFGVIVEIEVGSDEELFLTYYDHTATTVTDSGVNFMLPPETKGLTVVSGDFAEMMLDMPVDEDEVLLFAAKAGSGYDNRLHMYTLDGMLLGSVSPFTAADEIAGEIEAIAVDEVNNLIYIGDEEAKVIHVVQVPEPGALALLLGGVVAGFARRRR